MNSTQGIATLLPSALYRACPKHQDVRPAIRKALQTLTLQRSQAANEIGIGFCLLANEIGGVLVLAGALRADHTILTEIIHTLATVDRMMI